MEGEVLMFLKKISVENFTVFEKNEIKFCNGINVFIGNNGTGKTHLLKMLYAACQSAQIKKTGIDFQTKLVKIFRPDDFSLLRLARRRPGGINAKIEVFSEKNSISLVFNSKFKKNVQVTGSDKWSKEFESLTSIFIPAKEILSHSRNLIQAINAGNVDFDDTYKDIISAASVNVSRGTDSDKKSRYLKRLQAITQGKVKIENDEFYLLPTGQSQSKLEFQLVAEGLRKIALLWQLIKNGTLEKGSILFWDEPEANVNPANIPAIVDLLLDLQEDEVQIFISTHDYFVAKYINSRKRDNKSILFHSMFKLDEVLMHESENDFDLLENNSIIQQSISLYKEEVMKVME